MATSDAEASELDDFPVLLSPLARLEALQAQKLLRCTALCDYDEMKKTLHYGLPNLINAKGVVLGQTCMHIAAAMGKESMCSFLLNDCAILPDQADNSDTTPMMQAAQNGHERVVSMLLERGASVTAQDDEGRTAMFRCLCPTLRHCNIIDMLVKSGADCNAVNADGSSVLCEAASLGYDDVVGRLLECGADPNVACGEQQQTALMLAVTSGSTDSVKSLCTAGANVNITDSKGQSAAHKAAELGSFECLQILSGGGADLSLADSEGNTALHLAVEDGDLLNVKFLIQRGCPPGEENAAGMIPKKLADEYGMKAISKEIKKAMSQSAKVSSGSKPKNFSELWQIRLFDWMHEYKGRMIDLFHSFDANDDGHLSHDEFSDGLQRLGLPVSEDNIQALMTQLDKDKSGYIDYNEFTEGNKYVNKQYQLTAKDRDGKAKKGKKGKKKGKKGGKKKKGGTKVAFQIPILESFGKTLDGAPPPQFVEKFRYTNDMARFPRDHVPEHPYQNDSLWYLAQPGVTYVSVFDAVRHSDIQTLRLALVKDTPVDVRDQFQKTPLMHAAATGRIDAAKVLLDSGASVHAEDNFGWTPLHHACHAGQTALATWLVENDANVNKQSKNGGTPLMRAVECSKPEIVRLLLSQSPDLKLKNLNGQDVLQVAKVWADNVSLLLVQAAYGPEPEEDEDDKDKGKKGKKKGKKEKKKEKKPKKGKGKEKEVPEAAEAPKKPPFVIPDRPKTMPTPEMMEAARRRRENIARAMEASSIHPAKLFLPMSAWEITAPLRTMEVVDDKGEVRSSAGEQAVDFSMERSPFTLNILARVKVIEAEG